VVNNAGAAKRGDFLTLSEDDWTEGFALKFFGTVRLLRAAWAALKERKGAVVSRQPNPGSWTCRHARWTHC
jgi:3-oxoacyl-[acyl-carrier protein] reductase